MKLLTVFDLETTGLSKSQDHIIQIAMIKYDREKDEIVDEFSSYVKPIGTFTIGLGAYFKHKITPQMLESAPTLSQLVPKIMSFIDGCDLLTYNGNSFDIPFLENELKKVGVDLDISKCDVYDAFLEEKRRNGINLESTYKRYNGKTMVEDGLSAHDALSDVKGTLSVFNAQQKEQPYGPEQMLTNDNFIKLSEFNGEEVPCFSVGKYRDVSVSYIGQIDPGYITWVIQKSDVSPTTKTFIYNYINNR